MIILAGAFALVLLAVFIGRPAVGAWQELCEQIGLGLDQQKLDRQAGRDLTSEQFEALLTAVPKAEVPLPEEAQRLLFEAKFIEQLKKSGVNKFNLTYSAQAKKSPGSAFRTLRLQSTGKGNLPQLFELLANLQENPYFVSVEEFRFTCGEQNRQEANFTLAVSTFIK